MSKKTIGVAVIGTGRAGMIHAHNFAKNVKHANLVAIVDSDYQNLQRAGDELGCSSL